MKKKIAILLVTAVMGTAVFAQGTLSAGLYVLPNFAWSTDSDLGISTSGFGFGAYFDAKYVAVNVGMDFASISHLFTVNNRIVDYSDEYTYLTLGLLAKYPIKIGSSRFTIAPAVGFEYQIFLADIWGDSRADYEDMGMDAGDIDNFIIKFGALADFNIVAGLYARAGVLLDIGLPHKDSDPADTTFGFEIPIAIGYRF